MSALRGLAIDVACDLGWIDRRTRRDRAISVVGVRLGSYDDPRWIEFLRIIVRHRLFADLRAEPNIVRVVEAIVGRCEPEAGDLCRVVSGDDPRHTTVAHQDQFYLPGERSRWTAWIPLGDCPISLGPLAILPRSHRRGLLPHRGDSASRQRVDLRSTIRWAAQDLKAGDVLLFNWLTVHRALPNQRGRELRISATCRYRPARAD